MASSKSVPPSSATTSHEGFSLISNDKLLQIYGTMLKCRMLHARIRTLAKVNGAIRPAAEMNQEALAAGVVLDLHPGDTLAPSPGGFIPSFVKGLPLNRIIAAHSAGSVTARPRYAPLHLISPSLNLAAQLDKAIAAAAENKKKRNRKITVAFCGNSSASPELLDEAMRQAGKRNLPILLVCHSGPHAEEIFHTAEACGFPGVAVDGHDAVAIYRVSTEAMAHARRGSGPTLIECRPWAPSGQKRGGRKASDSPIVKMEKYLTGKALFDPKFRSAVTRSFRRELDAATKLIHSR